MLERDPSEILSSRSYKPSFTRTILRIALVPFAWISSVVVGVSLLANVASTTLAQNAENVNKEQPELSADFGKEGDTVQSAPAPDISKKPVEALPKKSAKPITSDFNNADIANINILPFQRDVLGSYNIPPHVIFNEEADGNFSAVSHDLTHKGEVALSSFPIPLPDHETPEGQIDYAASVFNLLRSKTGNIVTVAHPCPQHSLVLSECFTERVHPVYKTKKDHTGGDYSYYGPAYAPFNGVVAKVIHSRNGLGNRVVIINPETGLAWMGAHFSKISVKEGARITQGQKIGVTGKTGLTTGIHLHGEMGQVVQKANGGVVVYLFNPRHATDAGDVYSIEKRIGFLQRAFTKSGLRNKKQEAGWGMRGVPLDVRKKINFNNVPVEKSGRLYTPAAYAAQNQIINFSGHPLVNIVINGETKGTPEQRYNAVAGRKSTTITCEGAETQLTSMTCNEVVQWAKDNKKCVTSGQFAGSTLGRVVKQAGLTGDEHLTEGVQHLLIYTHIYENCGFQAVLDEKNPKKRAALRQEFKKQFAQQYRCMAIYGDTYPDKYASQNSVTVLEWSIDQAIDQTIRLYELGLLPDFRMENPSMAGPQQPRDIWSFMPF